MSLNDLLLKTLTINVITLGAVTSFQLNDMQNQTRTV